MPLTLKNKTAIRNFGTMKLEPQLSVVISFFRESNDSEKVALNHSVI